MERAPQGLRRGAGEPLPTIEISEEARELHQRALVIDAHADTPTEWFTRSGYDFSRRNEQGHIDLPRLREGGVDLQFMIAWITDDRERIGGRSFFDHTVELIELIVERVAETPGTELITESVELDEARRAGRTAIMIGVEGGHAIENSLENLHRLHELGTRYLTLTWNHNNDWADSATDAPQHGGLTPFGREVIRELNELRILIDLSHAAETTFYQVLETSAQPVIASHSCARTIADHPRNLDDQQLRELARAGGVVGVNFFPLFLDSEYAEIYEREGPTSKRLPQIGVERVIDHIEEIVEVAGIDHVALGSDFDGITTTPIGLPDIAALPVITELLLRRGFHHHEIEKILGKNLLHLIAHVIG